MYFGDVVNYIPARFDGRLDACLDGRPTGHLDSRLNGRLDCHHDGRLDGRPYCRCNGCLDGHPDSRLDNRLDGLDNRCDTRFRTRCQEVRTILANVQWDVLSWVMTKRKFESDLSAQPRGTQMCIFP